MALTLLSVAL